MTRNPVPRTPSYRLHKPTGQAVVTIDGRDRYLGKHGTPESRAEYDRLIAEWLANGRRAPAPRGAGGPTVNEILVGYIRHADAYYVKDGLPTSEPAAIRQAVKPLRKLYGHTPAAAFGPLALKAVRQAMIDAKLCRNEVNKRVGKVVRVFKWAVGEELVPPSVHHGLLAVPGLRKGRADVRESEPVRPVAEADVLAVRPFVSRQVWAMIELQRLSGMRPGEACAMRTRDVDRSGPVWVYRPASHKTEHHGRDRVVCLGPRAQEVLRPWLRADPYAYLFSPREARAEWESAKRAARRTPVQPSQRDRSKTRPKKVPGARYSRWSYRQAIAKACDKAGVTTWHPNQLRHSAATAIRARFGLESAQTILGHAKADVTQIYAERDLARAAEIMAQVG